MGAGLGGKTERPALNLLIFGVGFSGLEIAKAALAQGAHVSGTTRSAEKAASLAAHGIEPLIFADGASLEPLKQHLKTATHLVAGIAPDSSGDPVRNALGTEIAAATPMLEWVGYLSTVGVYGDHQGAWVNEETPCVPVSARSIERLKAEAAWRELCREAAKPVAILRLSGIYGPGRNTFVNLANGTARRIIKPGQFFNRIHAADIAGAAMMLAGRREAGLLNVTDDEPAPPQDVVTYAAKLMGIAPPPETAYDEAKMSAMARSFYGEVKRVSNAKIRQAGYDFHFPNYRSALDHMWQNRNWR